MLLPISSSLVFLTLLHLSPGWTSYQSDQLRMMLPYSVPDQWVAHPEEVDLNTLTHRQTRSMRYKGKTGLADRGELD